MNEEDSPDVFGEYFLEFIPDAVFVSVYGDQWYGTQNIGHVWPQTKAEVEAIMKRPDFPKYGKREDYRIVKFQPTKPMVVNCNPKHTAALAPNPHEFITLRAS